MCIRDRIKSADASVSDEDVAQIEDNACPGCGCCSGMFTANSMNCLNEAIGLCLLYTSSAKAFCCAAGYS